MIPTSTRRSIEKKTTSQSSAKAPSYTTGAVRLSTGPLPINYWNQSRRGNKQTKQATHAPVTKVNKQTNKWRQHMWRHCRWDNGPISEPPTETKLMARACHYHCPEICYEFDMQKPSIPL